MWSPTWASDRGKFRRTPATARKQVVEPVFGQVKEDRGFRQFFLRGLAKVKDEWSLICIAHNLLKLQKATKPI